MDTAIRFENVSKKYHLGLTRTSLPAMLSQWVKRQRQKADTTPDEQIFWALQGVNFELKQGESLALIGPNGAGKTTILKLLARITKPTSGQIVTTGRLSALIELGAGFHPDLSGRENIYLNGTILGLNREQITQRFDRIVEFAELERFIDTPVKRYSSGMTIRLGFAVASCIEPDILLIDEVLAVGDAKFRQKCINRIQELLDLGTSIVFVSHNLWLVQSVCSSALYIDKGQVKHRGTTAEVIDIYDKALSELRAKQFEMSDVNQFEDRADVEITDVAILDAHGQASEEIYSDQPAEIRATYIAYRQLGNVNVVVRILRSDGLTCCMMRSKLDAEEVLISPGRGVISVNLHPLQLRGGTYFAQVMIRDASDAQGIAVLNSDWIYVKGSVLSHGEMNGVFEPNRTWTHHAELPSQMNEKIEESALSVAGH